MRNLFKKLFARHTCSHYKKDKNIKQNHAAFTTINTIRTITMPIISYFIQAIIL